MQNIKGLVSCVTPAYNNERFLGRMLDSVLCQTWPQMEMILVDDGSEDGTVAVAESYRERFAQKGWRYEIVRGRHQNASAAINLGLPLVTGEFLIWPDSDDMLEPESVERRVLFLQEHPEYRCVRSLMYYVDVDGAPVPAAEKMGDLQKEKLFWELMDGQTFVCCGCYMLRSEEFFGVYPERRIPEWPGGQNYQMLLPYLYHYDCPTMQEKLYWVCRHPESHSQRELTEEERMQRYWSLERLMDELVKRCGLGLCERRRMLRWRMKRRYYLAKEQKKRLKMVAAGVAAVLCGAWKEQVKRRLFKK